MKKRFLLLLAICLANELHAQKIDLLPYINTLQGSHNTPEFSHGRCSPMVGYPHGMTLWAPRGAGFAGGGTGFGASSVSFTPLLGSPDAKQAEPDTKNAIAKPHYYKVTADNGITTEVTATERCGYFKLAYPAGKKAYLLINGSDITIDVAKRTITNNARDYFIISFDKPFISSGKQGEGKKGVCLVFAEGAKVAFKVAISQISQEQAQVTFDREIAAKNFNQVKDTGAKVWNDVLNQIVVEGGTLEQKKTFYSCLYRASLRPAKIGEVDKDGKSHFELNGKVMDGYFHSNPILWDAYRSLFPLRNIISVADQKEYLQSLLKTKVLFDWWEWRPAGPVMIGNHAISVFADAWAKGVRSFNAETVLKYYYHEVTNSQPHPNAYNIEHKRGYGRMDYGDYFAMGYIPYPQNTKKVMESTARTLEYTYDDFCAYQLAKMSGNKFYEEIFKKQIYNYKNVFDPNDHFMKGRDAEGKWQQDFNPYEWGGSFVEGNAWPWKWFAPHDVDGLVNLIGNKEKFAKELDELFTVPADSALNGGYNERIHEINESVAANMGQYGGINEPGFHIIYQYDHVAQPWKAQKLIRESLVKLFNSGPDGFMGDEDGGAVSAWYIFSAMGFFAATPGVDQYAIGSPLFSKAIITLENGKKFSIVADNNNAENPYIQSATLNGKPYSYNWISHNDIMNGGELHFKMSAQPNTNRGISEADKPFSVSNQK